MKVLLVEDDKDVRELVDSTLKELGMTVETLQSSVGAIETVLRWQPDVILLDQVLPGKSGIELLGEIRGQQSTARIPIIMITGLAGEADQIRALEYGADDYVIKPFFPRALGARIKAVMRRSRRTLDESPTIESGNLKVDFGSHKVFLAGEEVPLTLTEFKILSELLRENGRVLTRDRLRQRALGNLNVTDRTIDVHMASLRKKLPGTGRSIQTVRGVGYRYSAAM